MLKYKKIITILGIILLLITSCVPNNKINNKEKKDNLFSKTENNVLYSSYSTCLENTKNGPEAKDCCDCLSVDLSVRKACRDETVNYDFSKNTIFKTFKIPSILGIKGDYSSYTISGNQKECKQKCEDANTNLVCGDFQYCRTACNKLSE